MKDKRKRNELLILFFYRQKKLLHREITLNFPILYANANRHYLFFDFQTPVCDAKQRARRRFTADRTAWSSGASATTRFTTAACRSGSNRTIVARCASRSGLSNEWGSNPHGGISRSRLSYCHRLSSSSRNCTFCIGLGFVSILQKPSKGLW